MRGAGRVLAVAGAGRSRRPLVVLLVLVVLLGVVAALAHDTRAVTAQPRSPVIGTPAVPSVHGDPNEPLRLSALVGQAQTTTLPGHGWALCPQGSGELGQHGWSVSSGVDSSDLVGAAPATCRSRAPPSTLSTMQKSG